MEAIRIRRFSAAGSTVTEVPADEAEEVVQEAMRRGALVVDEETQEMVRGVAELPKSLLIVNPLQGG